MTRPFPAALAPAVVVPMPIGVGIDTSRYGHHASFLRPDLQPAAAVLDFAESAAGYAQLRQRLQAIAQRLGPVHFHVRLDVAGAYADNLLAFLQSLADASGSDRLAMTTSCGEPGRNKNYRVAVFGVFPVPAASGLDRDGKPRPTKRYVMCKRGSDLVRRYLYLAALAAAQHNPAVKPLYQRVRAKHADHPAIAVGHAMPKLLHLVFAVWKTGKPFDPEHYPWQRPAHVTRSDAPMSENEPAAGHNPEAEPDQQVVTAADSSPCTAALPHEGERPEARGDSAAAPRLDFAHLKKQLPLARVLEHLGLLAKLRGRGPQRRGPQRRGPCPIHAPQGKGRTFSVHLDENVFHCHDAACGKHGDVIDLWAALKSLSLRDAALDLVATFALDTAG